MYRMCIIKNAVSLLLLATLLAATPATTLGYVSCYETDDGCTLTELTELSQAAEALGLSKDDRINIFLDIIEKLQTLIAERQAAALTAQCLSLTHTLLHGSEDATTDGEVSKLQTFLADTGFYPEAVITGSYGTTTAEAVFKWQQAHGMKFVSVASGVGPLTRAKLMEPCTASSSPALLH